MFSKYWKDISFKYEDSTENILENICLTFNSNSKIGLIGKNGCGKTTLFKLMLGLVKGYDSQFESIEKLRKGYLPQELRIEGAISLEKYFWSLNPSLQEAKTKISEHYNGLRTLDDVPLTEALSKFDNLNGYNFEVKLDKMLDKFEMDGIDLSRKISTLSGGEKTKITMVRILMDEPDILFLDEPTNHLDTSQLEWLERFLTDTNIPYITISHDRKFLDKTVTTIWEIEDKELRVYSGNYSFYKYEKETEFNQKMHEFESQQKKIKQLKKTQGQRKKWASSYQGETGPGGNARTYEDVTNKGKKAMKRAKNIEKRIEIIIKKEEAIKPFIEKERKLSLHDSTLKNKIVLSVEKLSKKFEDNFVLDDINFEVRNGDRLAIKGKNGSGKSTLLKIITNNMTQSGGLISWAPKVKIGYYAQEYENLDLNSTILEEVIQGNIREQTQARIILGCFNIEKDDVNRKISTLSIGEKSKTALAKIIFSNSNVLVLDEPTNHLEISAREAFEDALMKFNGTVIFVSHDRYFCDKIESCEMMLKCRETLNSS